MGMKEMKVEEMIKRIAEELKKMEEIKPPEWSKFVKTGVSRERPPSQADWWWTRAASILRKIYLNKAIGVERLRKIYGKRKNRGHKPEHKYKASGAIIRKILQQLEAAGLVKIERGKGRVITEKGRLMLKNIAK